MLQFALVKSSWIANTQVRTIWFHEADLSPARLASVLIGEKRARRSSCEALISNEADSMLGDLPESDSLPDRELISELPSGDLLALVLVAEAASITGCL